MPKPSFHLVSMAYEAHVFSFGLKPFLSLHASRGKRSAVQVFGVKRPKLNIRMGSSLSSALTPGTVAVIALAMLFQASCGECQSGGHRKSQATVSLDRHPHTPSARREIVNRLD